MPDPLRQPDLGFFGHPDGDGRDPASRRAFIARGVALAGASLLLLGCESGQRQSGPTVHAEGTAPRPGSGTPRPRSVPESAVQGSAEPVAPTLDLTPPRREPMVRVRLFRRSRGETIELAAEGSGKQWLRIGRAPSRADSPGAVLLVLASPLRVVGETGGWTVIDATGHRSTIDGGEPIEIGALKGQQPAIRIDGMRCPGVARLVARGGDDAAQLGPTSGVATPVVAAGGPVAIDVVNVVPLEQYLPGVIAKELYATWKPQTFRAQAVAARTYACFEIAWWRDRRHFDVVAGQASQAYIGTTDSATALRAVQESSGTLLAFRNEVLPAYYSSACGGMSANARDAISDHPINDVPPLRARPPCNCCEWAPVWRWSSDQRAADAGRRISAWGADRPQWRVPALGPVTSIEVVQANQFGRPVRYRVSDGSRSAELPSEQFRAALNNSGGGLPALKHPVRSGNFEGSIRGGSVALAGRGYGHGVGMCQYGAEGMARDGAAWEAILESYYPGAATVVSWG